jgi:hypothetical protein
VQTSSRSTLASLARWWRPKSCKIT